MDFPAKVKMIHTKLNMSQEDLARSLPKFRHNQSLKEQQDSFQQIDDAGVDIFL